MAEKDPRWAWSGTIEIAFLAWLDSGLPSIGCCFLKLSEPVCTSNAHDLHISAWKDAFYMRASIYDSSGVIAEVDKVPRSHAPATRCAYTLYCAGAVYTHQWWRANSSEKRVHKPPLTQNNSFWRGSVEVLNSQSAVKSYESLEPSQFNVKLLAQRLACM